MKDPAVLFYIDTWLTATAEMDSDVRGWYLNLILHQYDKKDLPDDIEKLAVLSGVKFSEFERFKQVFEHVFKQKFNKNESGRLENEVAKEILRKREQFKDKRSSAGKLSYFIKYISTNYKLKSDEIQFIKNNVDLKDIDLKNEQVIKQVFEQTLELYINGDGNGNKGKLKGGKGGKKQPEALQFPFSGPEFLIAWNKLISLPKWNKKPLATIQQSLDNISKYDEEFAINQINRAIAGNWQGLTFSNTDDEFIKWKNQRNGKTSINNGNNKSAKDYSILE